MHKKGSVAVAIVVLLVIIIAVGAVWYYEAHPSSQSGSSAVNQNATSSQQSTPSEFTISEWNVQFQEPAGLGGLVYSISPIGILNFSTQQLEDMASSCAPSSGGIGALVRSTSTNIFDGDASLESSSTIGGYYYAFTMPNGMCSLNSRALTLQQQQTKLLESTILQTLQNTSSSNP